MRISVTGGALEPRKASSVHPSIGGGLKICWQHSRFDATKKRWLRASGTASERQLSARVAERAGGGSLSQGLPRTDGTWQHTVVLSASSDATRSLFRAAASTETVSGHVRLGGFELGIGPHASYI